ncbi:MAG: exodeoxyribonuclease VII small subunit [Geminicoccaceae bacterium]
MTDQPEPPVDEHGEVLSFEQALSELERIVQDLERGQLDLESALQAYERGTGLHKYCRSKLDDARLRVEKITADAGGEPVATTDETASYRPY